MKDSLENAATTTANLKFNCLEVHDFVHTLGLGCANINSFDFLLPPTPFVLGVARSRGRSIVAVGRRVCSGQSGQTLSMCFVFSSKINRSKLRGKICVSFGLLFS
jgi:hypothetical protein